MVTPIASSTESPEAASTVAPTEVTQAARTTSETTTTGNIYYVDNRVGSDSYDGKSATPSGSGHGPWQSLVKATAALNPGDTLRLACGGSWNETLKPVRSGTATAPIVIASYPANCSTPAAIDGATYIAQGSWTLYKNNIYKTSLSTKPLQLNSDSGVLTEAHHPNRGFNAAKPTSLYYTNAADSATQTVNGQSVSTYLTTGTDLALPAGATLPAGTGVRIRTNAWTLDETTISSVSGTRVNFSTPTKYPLKAGWGYYFVGQLWMLDSAGEWYWDSSAGTLYAWMPNSLPPAGLTRATTRAIGAVLDSMQYITLDGLWIRTTGTGVSAKASTGVVIQNARLEDIAGTGIDASNSNAVLVSNNVVNRMAGNAIAAGGSSGAKITGNRVNSAGVLLSNNAVVSLPRAAMSAILGGTGSVVTGNTVTDSAYNGITVAANSTVSSNSVSGACTVLDDGGGIYTSGANNNGIINGNVVQHVRGSVDGKGSNPAVTQAQGIYLDEYATGVKVQNNTVTDADNGIQVHVSQTNSITGNKLYGNRINQLWLQENSNIVKSTGDVFGNGLSANQIVPTTSTASGFLHETTIQSTTLFGQYDSNIYFDRVYSRIGIEKSPNALVEYTFPAWKAATLSNGTPRNQDPNGKAASSIHYATAVISGSNIMPNGNLATNLSYWTAWNQTSPYGVLSRVSCNLGFCAKYVAGASEGLVSTPNFSVVQNQWYRLTMDVQGSVDGQILNVVLRRGGGGANGYEPLSSLYAYVPITRNWTRLTFTVQATKTVNARDPVTLDNGARIDFGSIGPGQSLSVTNVEVVPVSMPTSSTRTDLLVNAGAADQAMACPVASSAPSLCGQYHRLSDNASISWPYTVSARNSEILYTLDPTLVDSDGDGIADSQDLCPATAAGLVVNASGCALGQ